MVMRFGGIVIQDKYILIVTTKGYDIFPGGKKDHNGESDKDCLKREFREELSGTEILVGDLFKKTWGIDPFSGKRLYSKLYFCYLLNEIGEPSAEITHKKLINSKDISKLNLTDTAKKNLDSLIKYDLID